MACACRDFDAEIGWQKSDNTDAHKERQAPVCGVMLFLPGFESVHWNKVETVTINYLYE